jgi:hypothetical protein
VTDEAREAAFERLLKTLRQRTVAEPSQAPVGMQALMHEFLRSFLIWEASVTKAEKALARVLESIVDLNELRICLPHEIIEIIGPKYPECSVRAARLRSSLNDLFVREHEVSLDRLVGMPKRDARSYLESLDGVPPFVAARVALLGLGAHAMPIDARLAGALVREGVFSADMDIETGASWLERRIRAAEARETYLQMEAWYESRRKRSGGRSSGGREKSPKSMK